MTRSHTDLESLGDPALAEMARADDTAAFAELWRRHAGAGAMAARQFAAIADPQDIVSEAYLRILRALQQGGGPHEAFRPYLYRTIHNIALDWRSRHPSVSLEETANLVEPEQSIEITVLENTVTAKAFEELPERWRAVLWYSEVEGMSPSDVAPYLGLTPNATSALAARAHEGFKKAWLQAHVNDRSVPTECQWTTERMGRYVRHSLARRSRIRFDTHLEDCNRCSLLLREIDDLGDQLASVLLPVALGTAVGSLLLGQLRDHAAGSVTATLAPLVAPSGTAIMSSATAVVLIASGALLAITPAEHPLPPSANGGEAPPSAPSPAPTPEREGAAPSSPPDAPSEPSGPPESAGSSEVASATPGPVHTTAPPPAAQPADAPLIDLSVSLLSGAVELGAVVDIDPSTGLRIAILPGLPLLGG